MSVITHIVLFKLKDRSPESVERTAQILRDMEGKIEVLQSIEVGTDVLHTERSFDIALTTQFASLDALQAYQVHPVHQKVIEHMATARETQISVDYES
ncbi:MAG: Dabb family protein [Cohnella sp.]|nr:Dabb family protein [Cohnella sp.]